MVYPSEEFITGLPDGRVPDRGDFKTFIDAPEVRIANWRRTAELAAPLGEEFLEDRRRPPQGCRRATVTSSPR